MSEGKKVTFEEARAEAEGMVESLCEHFERLGIAGSLRRQEALIGDIELVGILKEEARGLFGLVERTPVTEVVDHMYALGYRPVKAGDKYLQFFAPGKLKVDLFLCTPETWGCIFMIRTGSAEFTRRMVTRASLGGLCPADMKFENGRLWRDGEVLETPEEEDVFDEMGLSFVEPEARSL